MGLEKAVRRAPAFLAALALAASLASCQGGGSGGAPASSPPPPAPRTATQRPTGTPVPFVALASGRVGLPYRDDLDGVIPVSGASWATQEQLPPGLSLDPATGTVSGVPAAPGTTYFRAMATTPSGTQEVEAVISVFDGTEPVPGQLPALSSPGPWQVSVTNYTYQWTSSFDGNVRTESIEVFVPEDAAGDGLPLVVHHRGRGFSHLDYQGILTIIASHGIVCVTVSDPESFYDPDAPQLAAGQYDYGRPELGMESASAAQEGALEAVLGLQSWGGLRIAPRIDPWNAFVMGHSRGGGATQASHVRSAALRIRGAIYLMAYDLRCFGETTAPGVAPAYPIPDREPRLPSLVISAERDGDLTYPIADEFIDRAAGPMTFATILGACHDYAGENVFFDTGNSLISQAQEHADVAGLVVAFVRRWGLDDLSVDDLLYGAELEPSGFFQVASWRRSSPLLVVDDFQGADPAVNALGGTNAVSGLRRTVESVYPPDGNAADATILHSVLTLTAPAGSFSLSFQATDASGFRELAFRAEQTGSRGWDLGLSVTLTDAGGNAASATISQEGGTTGYVASYSGFSPLNRFVTVHVPLGAFSGVDLTRLVSVEFGLSSSNYQSAPQVVLDDVRFE